MRKWCNRTIELSFVKEEQNENKNTYTLDVVDMQYAHSIMDNHMVRTMKNWYPNHLDRLTKYTIRTQVSHCTGGIWTHIHNTNKIDIDQSDCAWTLLQYAAEMLIACFLSWISLGANILVGDTKWPIKFRVNTMMKTCTWAIFLLRIIPNFRFEI